MKKLMFILCMVCMVCLLFSVVAVAKDKAAGSKSMTGWIADEKCGAKNAGTEAGAACAKKCIEEGGSKAVFVNEKDKSVVAIHNQEAVKGHEGHHVKVSGSMMDNALHVDKVEMVADKGKKDAGKM